MLKIASLCLVFVAAVPIWPQVEPSASGGSADVNDEHMMAPPPVSSDSYPVVAESERRSNYLSGGLVVSGAYIDNLMLANSPAGDETYMLLPTLSLDRNSPRQSQSVYYSPGFQFYQHTSQLNAVTQNASAGYRFHMSPYAFISLGESFQQNYNLYNQGNPFVAGGISGAPGSNNNVPLAPFANQLTSSSNAGIQYQYSKNSMIGGSGTFTHLQYSDTSSATGLDDSNTADGSAFYSRRLSRAQYTGLVYQFSKGVTHPLSTYTVTNSLFGFYTVYFTRSLSVSLVAGPEHYTTWAPNAVKQGAWTPAIQSSFGWQGVRSSISAGYSYIVSGAGGLAGTYKATTVNANARVLLNRKWSLDGSTGYSNFTGVNSIQVSRFGAGGRTIYAGFGLFRRLTEKMNAEVGYQHFHQSYASLPDASNAPDSNRGFVAVTYQFSRPLGR